jgi:hypothetical protein
MRRETPLVSGERLESGVEWIGSFSTILRVGVDDMSRTHPGISDSYRVVTLLVAVIAVVGVVAPAAAAGSVSPGGGASTETHPGGVGAGTLEPGRVAAAAVLSSCTTIEQGGVYRFGGNVTAATAGTCVSVNASNVTIDGNGYALEGNGSGIALAAVRNDLSNVTVRNLTVRDWEEAIDLSSTTNATVEATTVASVLYSVSVVGTTDAVVRDSSIETRGAGVGGAGSERLLVENVTVAQTASGGAGVSIANAANATVRTVSATGDFLAGVNAPGADNATVRTVAFDGARTGVVARRVTEFDVENLTVAGASTALQFRPEDAQSSTRETAVVEGVTITDPRPRADGASVYAAVDGTNGVTLFNLSTPDGRVTVFSGANYSVRAVGPTPAAPATAPATGGLTNLTAAGANARVNAAVHYAGVRESTVDLYRADLANDSWTQLPAGNVTRYPPQDAVGTAVADLTNATDGRALLGAFGQGLTVAGCTDLDQSGAYDLVGDVGGNVSSGAPCVSVTASDVTIDGNGHTLTGNGSGTAVGVGVPGLSNVTVENLSVQGYEYGLNLSSTTEPTVRDVTVDSQFTGVAVDGSTAAVVANATLTVEGTAVSATDSDRARITNVTATQSFVGGGVVEIGTSRDALVADVTGSGPFFGGLGALGTRNLTVRQLALSGVDTGVTARRVQNLSIAGLTLANVETGLEFRGRNGAETPDRETATVRNATVDLRTGSFGSTTRYLAVDGSNDVSVALSTPNGTATVSGANVSLTPVDATPAPPAPANATLGRVNATADGPNATVNLTLRYDPTGINESTVRLYRVDAGTGSWTAVAAPNATIDAANGTVTTVDAAAGTYGAFAESTGNASLGEQLFPTGLPASSTGDPPTDVDGDGVFEDMDGNGRFGFTDVIEFVFSQQRGNYAGLTQQQVDALDLDGNGRVTFVDVIDLVFELQGS